MKFELKDGEATIKVLATEAPAVENVVNCLKKNYDVVRLSGLMENEITGYHTFMIVKLEEEG